MIEIFHQLDADQSGLITHDEVENVPVTILPPRVLDSICVENMADIFDYLDVDGTGRLSMHVATFKALRAKVFDADGVRRRAPEPLLASASSGI